MPTVPAAQLEDFATDVLTAAGLERDEAATIAQCLVRANLCGVDSHGVLRLIQYSQCLADGDVNPHPHARVVVRSGCSALIDADGGYGYRPTLMASALAVELATAHGMSVVGVRASHHFGMAATYAERIGQASLVGVVTTNTSPVMVAFGASRSVMGNNPMAFAVPRRPPRPPLIADMALSQASFGKVRLAAAEGRSIPLGWAYDSQGRPTTDAAEAVRSHLLAPMGGHKGYALSLMVDVLAGILTGSPVGGSAHGHRHPAGGSGHFVLAIRPDLFVSRETFYDELEGRLQEVAATPPAEGVSRVYLPGEIEATTRAVRQAEGVPVSEELATQLGDLASRLGVASTPWDGAG